MANNITLSSMFDSQQQALETQLEGLALPRDAEKIQSVVTNYLNGIFDDQGEFRQNLTQSEDYILQAALSLLNAQQEISKAFAQAKPPKISVPATNPFEKQKEEPMTEQNSASTFFSKPLDPKTALIGAGGGAIIGNVVLGGSKAIIGNVVLGGWGAVFGAIAGTAITIYLSGRQLSTTTQNKAPLGKQALVAKPAEAIDTSIPIDTKKFVAIVSQICESVDNLISTFRAQINRVVSKYENMEKPSLEKEYRILLEGIQSLIGYERTHSEDEKYVKKIQERIEDLGETLDNYNLTVVDYSEDNSVFFEKVKSPNTTQLKMVYPAITKAGNVVLKGKVFVPEEL